MDLSSVRQEYMGASLDERDAAQDAFVQFDSWFQEAVRAQVPMVNAMALATATASGSPSVRMVLLKEFDEGGFVFYTDQSSRKARELAANPRAALLLYWSELEREVRIEGSVVKTSREENEAYFASRPVGSRLAALASAQSSVIASRAALEEHYADAQKCYGDSPPCPPAWGGYRAVPDSVEFWQGRPNRLHDRLLYTRQSAGGWTISRLSP